MDKRVKVRSVAVLSAAKLSTAACCAAMLLLGGFAFEAGAQTSPVVLDRVVAVVNNRAILWSDITDALRLSVLEPRLKDADEPNAGAALEQLISRSLIEQQIGQEIVGAAEPAEEDVQARLAELRKELPACVPMQCATDEGWKAFLDAHQLTETQVTEYLRGRLEILAFIETRFRQGIRVSQEEIESYYRDSLLPQYAQAETAPALKDVAPRIEELLLQQQVSALFSAWLDNLRKQGDVEILDPALEPAAAPKGASQGAR
jgi:peptidyl-prolyl cis-trans isomerase SurA